MTSSGHSLCVKKSNIMQEFWAVPWRFSERDGLDVKHLDLVHRADSERVIVHQSKAEMDMNTKTL